MNAPVRKSFDDGVQFIWDATSLEVASSCQRKYYYQIVRGIRPASSSVHLIFGGVYASAMERYFKLKAEGADHESAVIECVRQALIETFIYDEAGKPIGPVPFLDANKTRVSLIRSIVWYLDSFGEDEAFPTYHLKDGSPAVELSFIVEFSDDIMWAGHLDRVVSFQGFLYWEDQKTTGGQLDERYFSSFNPHNQFMGYTWAGKSVLGEPLKGGIIDAAQIGAQFTRFERRFVTFSAGSLEEWREAALHHIRRTREDALRGQYPQNFAACGNYGGCPYRKLCSRSPSVRDNFLSGDYIEGSLWDPGTAR